MTGPRTPSVRGRMYLTVPVALSVAVLTGCATDDPGAGSASGDTAAPAEVRPAAVQVDVPGFTLGLPEGTSWETVGLHTAEATELSGAVRGDGDPVDLVLVWQEGERSPEEALDRALTDLSGRGVQVSRGDRVALDPVEVEPVAQWVTLESSTGTVRGLAAVWTCPGPDRTFSMMAHGGSDGEQVAVVDAVLAGFACPG